MRDPSGDQSAPTARHRPGREPPRASAADVCDEQRQTALRPCPAGVVALEHELLPVGRETRAHDVAAVPGQPDEDGGVASGEVRLDDVGAIDRVAERVAAEMPVLVLEHDVAVVGRERGVAVIRAGRRNGVRRAGRTDPALPTSIGPHEPDGADLGRRPATGEDDPRTVGRPVSLVVLDSLARMRDLARPAPVGIGDEDLAPDRIVLPPVAGEGDQAVLAVIGRHGTRSGCVDTRESVAHVGSEGDQRERGDGYDEKASGDLDTCHGAI